MDIIVIMCIVLIGICDNIYMNVIMLISCFVILLLYLKNDYSFI
jgi:hypothetical protein